MALNEAKEKVRQLENAIKKLDAIKRHLSHNASDIKVEIHSCVSHNLESLRGREVTLLSKVDELITLKEEALHQQQAKLNQALGVLQTRMAMMTSADSTLDQQLAEILAKFNEIDLSPGETPHIAFRADHMSLRECILSYGRVDSNALPSAFDNSKKPSASLPRHLEEYEDEDHHIFYKTVEELKEGNSTSKSITVTIPKLSTRMEDWLQKQQTPRDNTSAFSNHPKALPNQMSTGVNMSHCSTPGDTCSLNNWLSQIKSHADLEEEHNFEIVDNSNSRKAKSHLTKGFSEDLKQWLHTSSSDYLESLHTAQKQNQNLFKHIPSDSKLWLHQYHQDTSFQSGMNQMDLFRHISKEPSTWLKTRAYGKQTAQRLNRESTMEKLGGFKDKNIDQWLAQASKESLVMAENGNNNNCNRQEVGQFQTFVKTNQEKKSSSFQLEDICKANELCSTLLDCVCNPNCAAQCEEEMSGVKNPLDPTKVFNPPQLPMSQWLISTEGNEKMDLGLNADVDGEKNDQQDPLGKGMFSHIPEANSDQWLFKPSGLSSENNILRPTFKHCKEEANIWLQQAQDSTLLETNAKVILNFNPSNRSLSEWLMSPTKVELLMKEDDEDVMKEDSEGWSLCSSPATFNSEQFNKDVKAAVSYMQDWVL